MESVGENWESEFLQMAAYVLLTSGSASRDRPSPRSSTARRRSTKIRAGAPHRSRAPWPVRRGGLALALYRNSLSMALLALFGLSFVLHAVGGARALNDDWPPRNRALTSRSCGYVSTSRFWYESLQNWQSEFLAVLAIVVLSIFLRQHGSPESKPVHAPHSATGKG